LTQPAASPTVDMDQKILIVDDISVMRKIMLATLRQLGFDNLFEAVNGQEALEVLYRERFDLVISDWQMQPVDGLELYKIISGDATLQHLRFLLVTAEYDAVGAKRIEAAGIQDYLAKPFSSADLRQKVVLSLADQ
jgi:two-component system chemotaxis response regulator CheY